VLKAMLFFKQPTNCSIQHISGFYVLELAVLLLRFTVFCTVFTARRSYASTVLGVLILSVRPSVCLSVTHVLCD